MLETLSFALEKLVLSNVGIYLAIYLLKPIYRNSRFLKRRLIKYFPFVDLPDKNWSILDTFDSITPSYASTHENYEVRDWLKKIGFTKILNTKWGKTTFFSRK